MLYEQGAAGIAEYIRQTDDAGYAAQVAADRLDNLAGDLEELGGAFDTALIQSGSAANDALRGIVSTATEAVNAFNRMPEGAQTAALVVGAVGSATLLTSGALLLAVPKVVQFREALKELGPAGQKAVGVVGALGKGVSFIAGLSAAAVVLNKIAGNGERAALGVEATLQALRGGGADSVFSDISGDVSDLTSALDLLLGNDLNSNAERFGSTLNDVFTAGQLDDQVKDTRVQFETLGETLANLVNSGKADEAGLLFEKLAQRAQEQGYSVEQLRGLMPAYTEALAGAANGADDNADALARMEGRAEDAGGEIAELAEIIVNFAKATFDTRDAEREFQAAVDDLSESVRNNGRSLDVTTEAGRANEQALDDLAQSSIGLAAALVTQVDGQNLAADAVQRGRDQLIAQLEQFGITGQAAEDYADKLGLIPSQVTSYVIADTSSAEETVRTFVRQFEGAELRLQLTADQVAVNGRIYGGLRDGYASGGYTGNAPRGTVAGYVHAQEFVVQPIGTAIAENRQALEYMNRGGNIANFGYAPGGGGYMSGGSQGINLEGMTISGTLDLGNGLTGMIDGRIAAADGGRQMTLNAGRQVR